MRRKKRVKQREDGKKKESEATRGWEEKERVKQREDGKKKESEATRGCEEKRE